MIDAYLDEKTRDLICSDCLDKCEEGGLVTKLQEHELDIGDSCIECGYTFKEELDEDESDREKNFDFINTESRYFR